MRNCCSTARSTSACCLQELGYDPRGRPSLELDVAAELTGAWTVTAPADPCGGQELLAATAGLHVYGPAFLQARRRTACCEQEVLIRTLLHRKGVLAT